MGKAIDRSLATAVGAERDRSARLGVFEEEVRASAVVSWADLVDAVAHLPKRDVYEALAGLPDDLVAGLPAATRQALLRRVPRHFLRAAEAILMGESDANTS